ncbi:hypothetical protein KJ780_04720, partial [Candidatus Micrarchaeota archaeon]|nr:hypothetical protein [Candidatus Micrarchaeota archaeon]
MRKALIFIVASLLLFGCVTEKDVSSPAQEKVLSALGEDFDGDGLTDAKYYVFAPIPLNPEETLLMQKTVDAAQTKNKITVRKLYNISEENASDFEVLVFKFNLEKRETEEDCRKDLGINGIVKECTDTTECAALCTSLKCKRFGYASEFLGYWIHKFSSDSQEMDTQLAELKIMALTLKGANEQERTLFMEKVNALLDKLVETNNNPLFSEHGMGMCNPINYDYETVREMLSILGEYQREPETYNYIVDIKIVTTDQSYTELEISDSVPAALIAADGKVTTIQEGSTYGNGNVSWRTIGLTGVGSLIGYSVQSNQGMQESIFDDWPSSKIKTKI